MTKHTPVQQVALCAYKDEGEEEEEEGFLAAWLSPASPWCKQLPCVCMCVCMGECGVLT